MTIDCARIEKNLERLLMSTQYTFYAGEVKIEPSTINLHATKQVIIRQHVKDIVTIDLETPVPTLTIHASKSTIQNLEEECTMYGAHALAELIASTISVTDQRFFFQTKPETQPLVNHKQKSTREPEIFCCNPL